MGVHCKPLHTMQVGRLFCLLSSAFTSVSAGYGWGRRELCKRERFEISVMDCRLEWEQDCSTSQKKVGERVVYDKKCKDREVKDCKWVQFAHPKYPGFGIFPPSEEEYKCKKLTRQFCKDVPKREDVMGNVETCINTPKQVCEEEKLNTWRETCDRVKSIVSDSGAKVEEDAEVLDAVMEEERSGTKATEKSDSVDETAEDEDDAVDASTDNDEDISEETVEEPELEKSIAKSIAKP